MAKEPFESSRSSIGPGRIEPDHDQGSSRLPSMLRPPALLGAPTQRSDGPRMASCSDQIGITIVATAIVVIVGLALLAFGGTAG